MMDFSNGIIYCDFLVLEDSKNHGLIKAITNAVEFLSQGRGTCKPGVCPLCLSGTGAISDRLQISL